MPDDSKTETAAALAQSTPAPIERWRQEDPARRLYAPDASTVPDDHFDGTDLPEDQRRQAVAELRGLLADAGLSPADARQLVARGPQVRHAAESSETQREGALAALKASYGEEGAQAALQAARQLVQRDPRFEAYIATQGVGNDPETVRMLAAAALTLKAEGRLK